MSGHRRFLPDDRAIGFCAKPIAESVLVIGQIESVSGQCALTRPGSDPFQAKPGDPVCQGDIIETAAGGKAGIRFIDGTAFNLSNNARAVLNEFVCDGDAPSARVDISRGTFAFIAGEMAKAGRLRFETPFASIRGRTNAGGIGMLSLASLFFAALEEAQAVTVPQGIELGIINIKDSQDIIDAINDGQFGIIELKVHAAPGSPEKIIMLDDPTKTVVLRAIGSSISESTITNSISQMLQYQGEQQDVLRIFAMGQGPTISGPGGSGGLPPPPLSPFVQPINFVPEPVLPPSGPNGGPNGGGNAPNIFIPPPVFDESPPPPPPPTVNPDGTTAPTGSGNVLNNDTGGPLMIIHVRDNDQSLDVAADTNSSNGTAIAGLYGTLTIGADGTYSYVVDNTNAAVKALAEGETLVDNPFTYTATNGTTTAETTLTITVLGTNDAPTFTSEDPKVVRIETTDAEGSPPVLTASGSLFFTDPDLNDVGSSYTATILNLTVSGVTAGLPDNATLESYLTELQIIKAAGSSSGELRGQFSAPDSAFDYLSAGESVELKYEVQIDDGHGGTATQFVTVTIDGTNDAPVFTSSDPNFTRIETTDAEGDPLVLTVSGSLFFTDPDLDDVAATYTSSVVGVSVSGATDGLPAPATLESYLTELQIIKAAGSSSGELKGQFSAPDSAFDYLSAGQSVKLKYTVQIDDGHGGTDTQFVTVTITGTNDAPRVTGSAATVSEEGLPHGSADTTGDTDTTDSVSASGTISATDVDSSDTLSYTFGTPSAVVKSGGMTLDWTGAGTGTLVGSVGGNPIITATIDDSGHYTITISGPIDHPDTSSEDIKTFDIPVSVSDGHVTTPTMLSVTVEDDSPTAVADTDSVAAGGFAPATGNVILGGTDALDANSSDGNADTQGADGVSVSGVAMGNTGANLDSAATVGTAIHGQYGTLTINANGSYSYVRDAASSGGVSDVFTYTIKDGDGDLSHTTLTISIGDATPSDVIPAAGGATTTVYEKGLPPRGSEPAGSGEIANGLPNDNSDTSETTSGTISFSSPDGISLVSLGGHALSTSSQTFADGTTGSLTASYTYNAATGLGTISYSYTLLDNTLSDPSSRSFAVVVTDTDGDSAPAGNLVINVTDDAPTAVDNTRNVVEGTLQSADVQFIVDLSGSMFLSGGGGVGFDVPGFSDDRIGLARYSMQQLLLSNDQIENVQIVRFGDGASGTLWLTKAQALAFIQDNTNWTSMGGTNYDAALQQAITSFGSGPASPSEQSIVYFMSDGAPTAGGGIDSTGTGSNVSIAEWETHVTTSGIDQVFAIGIGNGVNVDNLEPIAFPNTDVQAPIGVEDNVILVSTSDVAALPDRLQDALELHSTISGNILSNDPGTVIGADTFGADGGRILKITIGGTTYTYDPTGNDISASSGPQPTQDTPVLAVTTALGGTFTFYFAASGTHVAGDWSYLTGTAGSENFSYVLVDGDGDQATAALSINVLPPPDLTFTLDLPGLDALQGNGLNKFKPMGTFASGSTYALGAGSDAGFAVSSDGILSTTSLSGQNIPSGTYTLNVIATDSTGTSHTLVVKIVVGTTGNDTINMATLGNPDGINLVYGLNGVDVITGDGGNDFIIGGQQSNTLQAGSGPTTLVAGPQGDTLKSGTGVDTFYGAGGNDTFVVNSTTSAVAVGGSGNNGTISGYDVINGFATASDFLDLQGAPASATGTTVNGADSTLTIGGQTVKSHTISNGIITFDDQNSYAASLSLTNASHVAAVVDYLQRNDLGNAGATVAFTATINGTAHTYIYEQVGDSPSSANDILVDLVGITLTSGGTSLSTLITNTHVKPAGIAGEPINLALSDPSPDQSDLITVTVSGLLPGWTLNGGTLLGDGFWTVQTAAIQSLTVTPPADFAGALALNVTETWINADGTPGIKIITDNLEAYAPGSPVFAWSGDDTLTGSSGQDLFVFAQPIGDDAIYGFNVGHDQIDLIGYAGFSDFDDVRNHLTTNADGNAVLTLADGQSITLFGVAAETLAASNFVFNQSPVMNNAGIMTVGDGAILPLSGVINNTGDIALDSAGNTTELELIQNGVTLQGGGQVILSDNDQNVIAGAFPGVTLINADNTISGAGQLGEQMILVNQGIIVATGTHALTIDTGSNAVTNSGILEATESGGLVVNSDILNSGLIWANGGNITIEGTITGVGSALISGGTLEFFSASSIDVTFTDGHLDTLVLNNPNGFTGEIFGFSGTDFDLIDLKGVAFDAGASWIYYDNDGSDTGGTLTVYENIDGTRTAVDSIRFGNGDYTTESFKLTDDGSGGIFIADTATSNSGTVIVAGNGGSTLAGTAESDTFVFKAIADSQPGAGNFDTITNFTHNSDHIDLMAIAGANMVQGPVDAAGTVDAHSISWFTDSANSQTIVYVNTTGTAGHVDMEIHLTGSNINLSGSDILHHT